MSLFTKKAAAPAAAPAKFGPFTLPGAKPAAPSKPGAKGTIFGRTPAPKPIKGGKAVKLDLKRGAKKAGKQAEPTDFFKDLRENDTVATAGLAAVAGGTVFAAGLLGLAFFNATSAGSGEAAAPEEAPKVQVVRTSYVTPQTENGATAVKPGASVEIIGKAKGGIDATPFADAPAPKK